MWSFSADHPLKSFFFEITKSHYVKACNHFYFSAKNFLLIPIRKWDLDFSSVSVLKKTENLVPIANPVPIHLLLIGPETNNSKSMLNRSNKNKTL
jgi:hypothetical protein